MQSRKQEATKKLIEAAIKGSIKDVRAALDDGAEINDNADITPLHHAVFNGKIDAVRFLLDNGADINKPASDLNESPTALMTAIQQGHTAIIDLLLSRGANVNSCGMNGRRPIMIAADNGDAATVKKLLQRGAEYMQSDRFGSNALRIACVQSHGACVDLLVDDLILKYTTNPKDLLIYLQTNDLLKFCLIHAKDSASFLPLLKLINFLYQHKYSWNDIHPLLPHFKDLKNKNYLQDTVAYLKSLPIQSRYNALQHYNGPGAYHPFKDLCYNYISEGRWGPISDPLYAVFRETETEINALNNLKDKTELKKKLYYAAKTGDIEAAAICIANGAPVNEAVSSIWDLPIYVAVTNGHAEMVDFLIQNGADKNYYHKGYLTVSETLSEAATTNGDVEVLKVLDQHGALPNYKFNLTYLALVHYKIEAAKFLFERGYHSPVSVPGYTGEFYVLMSAVIHHPAFLNFMIDTILTWPIEKIKNFLVEQKLQDCFFQAMVNVPLTFMPLMRLIDHLYASGVEQKFIDKFVPKESFFGRLNKQYKQKMLDKADELPLEKRKPFLAMILDPKHFYGQLARKTHGALNADESHAHSTLGKAAAMMKEVDAKLAASQTPIPQSQITPKKVSTIFSASIEGKAREVASLLRAGENPNQTRMHDYFTPLMVAADNGRIATVETLLKHGAMIDTFSNEEPNHRSALSLACARTSDAILKILIQHMITNYKIERILQFLQTHDNFKNCMKNANSKYHQTILKKLIDHLFANNISSEIIASLLPEVCELPKQASTVYAAATAIKDSTSPVAVPVTQPNAQPVAMPQPVAVPQPVAAQQPKKYINPFFTGAELAFSSDDIPANLPTPMEPVKLPLPTQTVEPLIQKSAKAEMLAEVDRFFSAARESVQPAAATHNNEQNKKALFE